MSAKDRIRELEVLFGVVGGKACVDAARELQRLEQMQRDERHRISDELHAVREERDAADKEIDALKAAARGVLLTQCEPGIHTVSVLADAFNALDALLAGKAVEP